MTHSLHRVGSLESLANDICIMAFPQKNVNYDGSKPALQWFFKTAYENGAVNLGMVICGSMIALSIEEVIEKVQDGRGAFTVFDNIDKATAFVKRVKEKDLGISITVSALWDLVEHIADEAGLKPHSVNRSLGIWGATEKLPAENIRAITSMCGHAQVSHLLVEKTIEDIKAGRISAREGVIKLAKPCVCGFFNPGRAGALLTESAEQK